MSHSSYNQDKWDQIARASDQWFRGVTSEELENARSGNWKIKVTAQKEVPRDWLEPIKGAKILCLAGAGGRQAPLLAALGAKVTVLDISVEQLNRDRMIAEREGLQLELVQGPMTELKFFHNEQFDLVLNPCSVCYVENVRGVWDEAFRVLKADGSLITGVINPVNYLFDELEKEKGNLVVKNKIPYSDLQLSDLEKEQILGELRPIDFGHSLSDLVGGLIDAGFALTGFFEDTWGGGDRLSEHLDVFIGVRATKPAS